jgi:methionyl-tRNA formyltransferase
MDEGMDHGAIVSQTTYDTEHNPIKNSVELGEELARKGGVLLASIIPDWIDGKINAKEQDHSRATFTKKINKEDGRIDLNQDGFKNYLKYLAYQPWPGVFFFTKNKDGKEIRMKVTDAEFENGEFRVLKVIPENGREINYSNLNI